eukprot:gene2426-4711_t
MSSQAVMVPFDQKLALGAIAGISGTGIVYPFDIIKTQLQTQNSSLLKNRGLFSSVISTGRLIVSSNGPFGLYRGFVACLVGIAPEKGIKLAVNDVMREHFISKHPNTPLKVVEEVAAGSIAGLVQLVVTVPYEHVKIKLQMQGQSVEPGLTPVQILRKIGFNKLYLGFTPTLLRDVPFCFLFFPLYTKIKALQTHPTVGGMEGEPFHVGLVAGMGAGVVAGALVTPADMIKTRIQQGDGSDTFLSMVRQVVKHEGLGALYRGWQTRILIIGPLYGSLQTKDFFCSVIYDPESYILAILHSDIDVKSPSSNSFDTVRGV